MGNTVADVPWLERSVIEQRADEMREGCGQSAYPVDPFAIARVLRIPVLSARFNSDSISGMLQVHGDGHRILVNADHAMTRSRYTVAHELGHYELHRTVFNEFIDTETDFYRREREYAKSSEIQANMFAAALLMPASLIRNLTYLGPRVLADKFAVSEAAMRYRIANLGETR